MPTTIIKESTSLNRIETREKELKDLYDRQDQDRRLAYYGTLNSSDKYVLTDVNGEKVPRSISITMNDAQVYAQTVCSATKAALMQIRVEGLAQDKNSVIEKFLERNIEQSDERRRKSLHNFVSNQANIRGIVAARWISYVDKAKKKYIPDCLMMDSRYLSYEEGADGIWWYGYRTNRSKLAIKTEYGVDIRTEKCECAEYWDGGKNEVWLDKKLSPKGTVLNPLGFPPVAIQGVDRGYGLLDEQHLAHEFESIFMVDRYLYDELNRIASEEATINLKLVNPAYQKETSDMSGKAAPYPDTVGTVTEVPINEKYQLLQVADINQASKMIHGDIMRAIQNGSLSDLDYGNLAFPLSAVAITDMTDIRNKIMIPTFNCLALFYRQLYRLIIAEYIAGGISGFPVGRMGNSAVYTPKDLGDPDKYTINLKFMPTSKRQDIANLSMSIAAKGEIPRKVRIREIMQVQNPEEWEQALDSEEAETLDPAIKLYRIASSLLASAEVNLDEKEGDRQRTEAKMMGERAVQIIKQRKIASQLNPTQDINNPPAQKGNAQPLMAMFQEPASRTGGDQTNQKERNRAKI